MVKATLINIQHIEGGICYITIDTAIAFYLGVISYAPQETIGNARCTSGAASDFIGTIFINANT
jgi:hypothetical protein